MQFKLHDKIGKRTLEGGLWIGIIIGAYRTTKGTLGVVCEMDDGYAETHLFLADPKELFPLDELSKLP